MQTDDATVEEAYAITIWQKKITWGNYAKDLYILKQETSFKNAFPQNYAGSCPLTETMT